MPPLGLAPEHPKEFLLLVLSISIQGSGITVAPSIRTFKAGHEVELPNTYQSDQELLHVYLVIHQGPGQRGSAIQLIEEALKRHRCQTTWFLSHLHDTVDKYFSS
jgi:hypothetical protein